MKKCIFGILFFSLFLSGCWDRRELNQLAIAVAIGFDKVDDEYLVSAQVVVPSEISAKGGTGSSQVTLFTASGETVYEAFRKMTKESPRKIYPGHLQILVIGEGLAQEGISESLDVLSRDYEVRPDFYVVVAKEISATEILNVTTTIESVPANKMFKSLNVSEKAWAGTKSINLDELISDLISDGKEAAITGIRLIGDPKVGSSKQNVESITPAANLRYDHLAVFKGDKLVGWLTEDETVAFSFISNTVKSTVRPISCPKEGKATIEIIRSKAEVKGNINNGKPEVDVNVKVEGNIGSVECKININDLETIAELEKIYEKRAEEIANDAFESIQKQFNADIFGFGEAIHRSNPKEWNKMKNNWDEEFSNLTMNYNVDLEILRTGTINKTFLKEIKE
ncbi:spore gernimation protein GerC [Solibacillus sp. R5-41]|uniref:Ger(x)C family spore germination protein n=1 Tax=Solibacillus sp. R5-41 TaxID=2048654 RepID=UPI000C124A3E|nr:Ger(x)C family spore germination protein [Solibacillus sp. R5-41]ATP39660.1 spore gernimation protein GerC [Solibacillus sp. R5-41]